MSALSFVTEALRHYAALAWVGLVDRWERWRLRGVEAEPEETEGVDGWGTMAERRRNIGSASTPTTDAQRRKMN